MQQEEFIFSQLPYSFASLRIYFCFVVLVYFPDVEYIYYALKVKYTIV